MSTITLYEIYRIIYGKSSRNILCLHVYSYLYTRYAAGCDKGDRKPLCLNVQSYLCTRYKAHYGKRVIALLYVYMFTTTTVRYKKHVMRKTLPKSIVFTGLQVPLYQTYSIVCEESYRKPLYSHVYSYFYTRYTAGYVRRVIENHYV